jgi:hypothetical protein
MVLAAKFQSFPLFLNTLVEPIVPRNQGALLIVNRARWLVNTLIILWYTMTAPCFGSQITCNAHVRSHYFFAVGYVTQAPQRVTSIFNAGIITIFIFFDVAARVSPIQVINRIELYKRLPHWLMIFGPINWVIHNAMPPLCRLGISIAPQLLPQPATTANRPITFLHRIRYYARILLANIVMALPYPKFQRYVAALAIAVILIWDIEETILDNTVAAGENAWTYGQILAVLLAAVPVIQLLHLFMTKPQEARRMGKPKLE